MEYQETWGALVRQFLRELFGSRLVDRLELDLLNLRNDMDRQLHDRDILVATLREEKQQLMSKLAEITLIPRTTRPRAEGTAYEKPAAPAAPKFSFFDMPPTKSRWQVVQEEHEEKMRKEIEEEEKAANAAKG